MVIEIFDNTIKISGFSSLTEKEEHYFECEKCGCHRTMFRSCGGKVQCPKCKHIHEEPKFLSINEKAVICSECGETVTLIPENYAYPFYMCPTVKCNNMVAVCYEKKIYQPLEPLKKSWNNENVENGIKVKNNLSLLICEDDRSLWVAKIINDVAISEESSFLRFKEEHHKISLLYNDSQALGYLMWSEEKGEIILRQLFVLESFRNNGYGTLLVDEWVKNFVDTNFDKFKDKFKVQDPIPTTINILIKLGYFSFDNKKNNKCSLIA